MVSLQVTPNVSASVNASRPHPDQRLYIRPKYLSSARSVTCLHKNTLPKVQEELAPFRI